MGPDIGQEFPYKGPEGNREKELRELRRLRKNPAGKTLTSGEFGRRIQKAERQPGKVWERQLNQRREDRPLPSHAGRRGWARLGPNQFKKLCIKNLCSF